MRLALAFVLALVGFNASAAELPDDETQDRYLVVVGESNDFAAAKKRAVAASHTSGIAFSMRGLVFDKKRGLILPDSDPDEAYAGSYLLRRGNEDAQLSEFISVELTDAYDIAEQSSYVVLAGIYDSSDEAHRVAARFGGAARIEKTRMYMGCMH